MTLIEVVCVGELKKERKKVLPEGHLRIKWSYASSCTFTWLWNFSFKWLRHTWTAATSETVSFDSPYRFVTSTLYIKKTYEKMKCLFLINKLKSNQNMKKRKERINQSMSWKEINYSAVKVISHLLPPPLSRSSSSKETFFLFLWIRLTWFFFLFLDDKSSFFCVINFFLFFIWSRFFY